MSARTRRARPRHASRAKGAWSEASKAGGGPAAGAAAASSAAPSREPSNRRLFLLRGGVTAVDFVPVDDVPPGVEVIAAVILVFEIVGMLPHVVAQDGIAAIHEGAVLIGRADDLQLPALVQQQPGPAGAEALQTGIVERRLELIEGPELLLDGLGDGAGGGAAAIGFHDGPEHAVIGMAAAVVAHRGANVLGHFVGAAQEIVHGQLGEIGASLA